MCGISGYIFKNNNKREDENFFKLFSNSLVHRGPDQLGYYKKNNIALINNRLSIIDIENGSQPFYGDDENIIVIQNGEIYNYIEIKELLIKKGFYFKTNSDTEVILIAYTCWGDSFINKLNGMFSIAILDKKLNKLKLFRDRLGVKPLYYYEDNNVILFSSEIKSFLSYKGFKKELDNQSILNYLTFNYVTQPDTVFKNVKHVRPGYFYSINLFDFKITQNKYWFLENINLKRNISEEKWINQMEELLYDAVKIRLRSDVDVGAFLSGGLDSSLVTCFMSKFDKSFSSYCIGFNEKRFDESSYATYVADKYNFNNEIRVLGDDIIGYWNKVTWFNDQPHGDISFIPTYLLSKFASEKYKVVLTGDGGDELFAGYTKYLDLQKNPQPNDFFNNLSLFNEKNLSKLLHNNFKESVDFSKPNQIYNDTLIEVENQDIINKVLYFDTKHLLPGNNLVKPDKMAMAHGLETRSPFLDYRFFELSQSMPGDLKLKNGETKYILKKFAEKYFDKSHVYRDKQMFTVPVGEWFKDKLKNYLLDYINSKSLKSRGIFDSKFLEQMSRNHISGNKDYTRELRSVVNLEIWFNEFM